MSWVSSQHTSQSKKLHKDTNTEALLGCWRSQVLRHREPAKNAMFVLPRHVLEPWLPVEWCEDTGPLGGD